MSQDRVIVSLRKIRLNKSGVSAELGNRYFGVPPAGQFLYVAKTRDGQLFGFFAESRKQAHVRAYAYVYPKLQDKSDVYWPFEMK